MGQCTVLIVDDEPTQRKVIQHVLEKKLDYNTVALSSGMEAIDYITSCRNPVPDVVLLDLSMPVMDGMEVIRKLRPLYPHLPIIVLTIYGDIEKAVAAIKAGATDFLAKPVAHERLRTSINNALKLNQLAVEVARLRRSNQGAAAFEDIIGHSAALEKAKAIAARAAESLIPVLLEGESGVGKELFAKAIHGASDRAHGPFVAVNCGAVPENLAESIFFGHEKGAFTGASYRSLGKFREAEGGTLFLDEVSELSPALQVMLLRALQESEIQPVGAEKNERVDVRVVAASNTPLSALVQKGTFREDLFYRLSILPVPVPCLREREGDIAPLAKHFLRRFSALENKPAMEFSSAAFKILESYSWPGNIRQLENLIFRLVVLSDDTIIEASQVTELLPNVMLNGAAHTPGDDRNHLLRSKRLTLVNDKGEVRKIRHLEEDVIYFALKLYNGRISEAARKLGIGRSTLYRKMSELNIDVDANVA